MKTARRIFLFCLTSLFAACSTGTTAPAGPAVDPDTAAPETSDQAPTALPPLEAAEETLVSFFDLLNQGSYEEASRLYGGDYEVLQMWNPSLDPEDYPGLFMNGCELNGLQCLQVMNILSGEEISPGEFLFVVEFAQHDGSRFTSGPCCGAAEEEMPPVSEFPYIVTWNPEGQYRVMDLPVYLP